MNTQSDYDSHIRKASEAYVYVVRLLEMMGGNEGNPKDAEVFMRLLLATCKGVTETFEPDNYIKALANILAMKNLGKVEEYANASEEQ